MPQFPAPDALPVHLKAASLAEARAILAEWSASGADLFRGQNHPWPPVSSDCRRHPDMPARIQARDRFIGWLTRYYGLADTMEDTDRAIAIAQHYGFPTPFLDVTGDLEVALGFALRRGDLPLSPIVFVTSEARLTFLVRRLTETGLTFKAELLDPSVPGFLRMQHQRSRFLFLREALQEQFGPTLWQFLFCSVSFPDADDPEAHLLYNKVLYPETKSEIEIAVDQWHAQEADRHAQNAGAEQMLRDAGVPVFEMDGPAFDDSGLQTDHALAPDPSWPALSRAMSGRAPDLDAAQVIDLAGLDADPAREIDRLVELLPAIYPRPILPTSGSTVAGRLRTYVDICIINGADLAIVLEGLAHMKRLLADVDAQPVIVRRVDTVTPWLEVEYTTVDGGAARAMTPRADIRARLRPEVTTLYISRARERFGDQAAAFLSADPESIDEGALLLHSGGPRYAFQHNDFVWLHLARVLPSTLLHYPSSAVVAHPERVEMFGVH